MTGYRAKHLSYVPLVFAVLLIWSGPGKSQPADPRVQMSDAPNNVIMPAEAAQGWISLFDGHSMTGWQPVLGDAPWMVDDGALSVAIVKPAHGDLLTKASFSDFELKLEFWIDTNTANSGVYLRGTPKPDGKWGWYEVNISDSSDKFPTGSISNYQSTLPGFRADTAGKWNTMDITAEGSHIVVKLNGKTTVDLNDTTYTSGPIGLQGAAGMIKFRNIKIRPIAGGHGSGN